MSGYALVRGTACKRPPVAATTRFRLHYTTRHNAIVTAAAPLFGFLGSVLPELARRRCWMAVGGTGHELVTKVTAVAGLPPLSWGSVRPPKPPSPMNSVNAQDRQSHVHSTRVADPHGPSQPLPRHRPPLRVLESFCVRMCARQWTPPRPRTRCCAAPMSRPL